MILNCYPIQYADIFKSENDFSAMSAAKLVFLPITAKHFYTFFVLYGPFFAKTDQLAAHLHQLARLYVKRNYILHSATSAATGLTSLSTISATLTTRATRGSTTITALAVTASALHLATDLLALTLYLTLCVACSG